MDSKENTPTPSPATDPKVTIDGKEYSVNELQEAIKGGLRQDDYTRKTQAVAEERRRLEEWEAELEARTAEIEQSGSRNGHTPDEDDPWVQRFSALESKIEQVNRTLTEKQKAEMEEREVKEQMEAIEAALHAHATKPAFDRQAVLQTMKERGWNRPEDVEAAYQLVAGPKIWQSLGERAAAARGASEPPPMGATGFPMTTPFSSPQEAAPGFDASKLTWQELARMAQEDPNRPR